MLASGAARRPVPAVGADGLLPRAAARRLRRPDGPPPAAPGDHHHRGRQRHGGPVRDHVPVPDERGDRARRSPTSPAPGWSPARSTTCRASGRRWRRWTARSSVATQLALLLEGRKLAERAARWLLHNRRPPFDIQATIDFFADGVRTVGAGLPKLLTGRDLATFAERQERPWPAACRAELAERVAAMVPAYSAFDIVERRRQHRPRRRPRPRRSTSTWATGCRSPGSGTGSSRCPATTGGTPWPAARCATTCTPRMPALARDVLKATGPGSPGGAAGGVGRAQRGGRAARRADPDRDLGERAVHVAMLVGGGAGRPQPRWRPARSSRYLP